MKSRRNFNFIISLLLFCIFLTAFSACANNEDVRVSDMSLEELEERVNICEYKDVEIKLGSKSRGEAILEYIETNSSIKNYPGGTVDYYAEQLKAQYHYYAEQADMKYEEMLDQLYEDNFTIKAEAKALVKKDMILELIRKKEGIKLTDEEKSEFFDRYVKKYASEYQYSEEYVREELSDLVCDLMLNEKTVEFLIINNTFIESTEEQTQN